MKEEYLTYLEFQKKFLSKKLPVIDIPIPQSILHSEWFQDCQLGGKVRVCGYPAFDAGIYSGKGHPALGVLLDNLASGNFDGVTELEVPSSGNFIKDITKLLLGSGIKVNGIVSGVGPGKIKHIMVSAPDIIQLPEGISSIDHAYELAGNSQDKRVVNQYIEEGSITGWKDVMEHIAWAMNQKTKDAGWNFAGVMGTCATLAAANRYARPLANGPMKIIGVASMDGQRVPGSRTLEDVEKLRKIGGFAFRPEWVGTLDFLPINSVKLDEALERNVELLHATNYPIAPTGALDELGFYKLLEKLAEKDNLGLLMNQADEIVVCLLLMDSYLAYLDELQPWFKKYGESH